MTKKKVLFIGQLAPPVHGVSVMNDTILSSSLLNNEYSFIIVNLTTAKTIKDIGKQSGVKYFKFISILFSVFSKLILNKIEFAYLTLSPIGYAFIKDSIIVELVKFFGVPVILHLHGKGIDNAIITGGEKAKRRYNNVFKGTNVIVLSEKLKSDIQQITTYKNCYIVNNGIKPLNVPDKKSVHDGRLEILLLSNLIKTKGAMDLLVAVKYLLEKTQKEFLVTFAGSWGEESFKDEFIRYIADNKLEEHVNLSGPVYGEEKDALLAKSDIFVLPTYYANECFPLTILEAMMYKLPIISTFEGAIPEIIDNGENGLLVDSCRPEELALEITRLLEDNELRIRMGMNSSDKFNRLYTLDIFEQNLLDVFNKIAK